MDWGTAIIGLITVFICIVPFVIMHYNRLKKENKMFQALIEIAKQNNGNISQHEFCGDFVLGIDDFNAFVFYFKQKREDAVSEFVDLSDIQTCQVVKKIRNIKNDIANLSIIERVELCFTSKNMNKEETKFELYDEEINMQLSGELQLADKWVKIINDRLAIKK